MRVCCITVTFFFSHLVDSRAQSTIHNLSKIYQSNTRNQTLMELVSIQQLILKVLDQRNGKHY